MKKLLSLLVSIGIIIVQANALTLTQKLGSEYITTTVEAGEIVNMEFTSKTGYKFKSWTVESGGINIDATAPSVSFEMPNKNVTIRGNYDATYTITFNKNGGTGSMANKIISAGGSDTLPINTSITKSGHIFKGWSETIDGEVEYADGASITPTKNMTLYAVWEEIFIISMEDIPVGTYIAYTPASGTVIALGTDTGTGSNQTFTPTSYTSGWKVIYNNNGQLDIISAESVGSLTLGKDATVSNNEYDLALDGGKTGYAKAIYTLNKLCDDYATGEYAVSGRCPGQGNGLNNLFDEGITLANISHANVRTLLDEGTLVAPYLPYRDSYNSIETNLLNNTLLHESGYVWLASRNLETDNDLSYFIVRHLASTGSIDNYNLYYSNSGGPSYSSALSYGVRPIITLNSGLRVVSGDGLTPETAYVLEATSDYEEPYTISFNSNGGTGSIEDIKVIRGNSISLSQYSLTKEGSIFKGWSTTTGGNVEYEREDDITPTKNMTLYAVWEEATAGIIAIEDIPVGAYIAYQPNDTSCTVLSTDSGYSSDQTYNPSSITSWKVFKNNSGQIDITSSESVGGLYLKGETGYAKAVYTLNKMCSEYVNSTYATSGRSLGYVEGSSQEIIDTPITWEYTYNQGNTGFPYTDTYYTSDQTIIKNTTDASGNYPLRHSSEYVWLASRNLKPISSSSNFYVRSLNSGGSNSDLDLYYSGSDGTSYGGGRSYGVRPVVSLKSGLKVVSGDGLTEATAYVLESTSDYEEVYTISFNSNGGTGSIEDIKVIRGNSVSLSPYSLTKEGSIFKGWSTTAGGNVEYEREDDITPTKNMTLYAVWEEEATSNVAIEDIPVGAYIAYTPANKTVTVLGTDSGTGSNQTFNTGDYEYGWKVMYNNDGQLDIISAESVVDGLIIGTDTGESGSTDLAEDVDKMRTGFAKAPYVLNKLSSEYATGQFAVSGRSLGSAGGGASNLLGQTVGGHQITIDDVSHTGLRALIDAGKVTVDGNGLVSYPYMSVMDMDALMEEMMLVSSTSSLLHSNAVNEYVWLAYRDVYSYSDYSFFFVYILTSDGDYILTSDGGDYYCDFLEYSDGYAVCISFPCGVRPVISLESGLRVVSGDGLTVETAYVLSR